MLAFFVLVSQCVSAQFVCIQNKLGCETKCVTKHNLHNVFKTYESSNCNLKHEMVYWTTGMTPPLGSQVCVST